MHALEITYQPILNLTTGRVEKCEALCRPQEAGADLAFYVDGAERDGTIKQFTERVIDETLADWRKSGPPKVALSLNLSVTNLSEPDIVKRIEAALKKHRFPANALWFEFDDRAQSINDLRILTVLTSFNKLGIRLSIDSFGDDFTQATLYEVQRLAVAELKVDGRFVRDADENIRHRNLIKATVSLAQQLRIGVSAKGIESEKIAELMLRMGCTHGQGFYFARPMSAVAALVEKQTPSGPAPSGR
ncbi:MAG: hypothetical protein NVS4B5_02340 [Vulcanimicrobiaceae bacterium]